MRILLILPLLFINSAMAAQELKLHETQHGFFVPLGLEMPGDFSYRISRKEAKKDFIVLGETTMPQSIIDYQARLQSAHALFPKLMLPNENQIERIWNSMADSSANNRLPILSPIVENLALGRAWQDTTAESGKTYQYKIEKIANGQTLNSRLTEEQVYRVPENVPLPVTNYLSSVLYEGDVIARWLLLDKSGIAGYEVFRQDNLRGGFHKINVPLGFAQNLDSTFVHVKDTLADKLEVYEYKLRPFDLFGNPGRFTKVQKISNFSSHDFPVLRSFKAVALDERQIKIQWKMDFEPFLRSIKVLRSMSFDSGFVEIAEVSPQDSSFTDVLPRSMENYYYRLKINGPDEVGISTSSTFILYESDLQPARPGSFTARTVTGGVELYWEDQQRNVFGYYVFRKEDGEDFVQVSDPISVNETGEYHFIDSATSLHGDRFYDYAIKTISDSYVLSQFSDTLSVRPGKEVTIAAPKNLRGRKSDGKVYLFWDDLSHQDENLMGYKLFRKRSFEQDFMVLHDSLLQTGTNHFIDSTMEQGYAYDYAVRAYNYFGSESSWSNQVQFQFYLAVPSPPAGVQAQKIDKGIRIVWGEVRVREMGSYKLYRYSAENEPALVASVPGDQHAYVDDTVERGQLYFYYVTSSNSQEIEGRPSEKVSVRY